VYIEFPFASIIAWRVFTSVRDAGTLCGIQNSVEQVVAVCVLTEWVHGSSAPLYKGFLRPGMQKLPTGA
jgi:hypothetical protein